VNPRFCRWRRSAQRQSCLAPHPVAAGGGDCRGALTLFVVQLALNAAWTPTFFGAHLILPALVVITVLWFAILATLLAFRRVSGIAALFLAPYLAWVSIATVLNFEIWRLNSG